MKYTHIKSIQAQGKTACGKWISQHTLLKTKDEIMAQGGGILCPKCLSAAKKQNRQMTIFPDAGGAIPYKP